MVRGMFAAISGLKSHQVMLDVAANDIANVNTIAYKGARTTFKDSLTQIQRGASGPTTMNGGSNGARIGLGVQLGSIDNLMQIGALQTTGNPLDVAIQGDGFFRIGQGAPPTVPTVLEYTRAGNFTRNQAGHLVTQDGYYVVGKATPGGADAYLSIPSTATNVAIGQDGNVSYIPAGGGPRQTVGFLSVATFPNQAGLDRAASNRWAVSASSGSETAATPSGDSSIAGGVIEMSNVDLAQTFTALMTAQRGFQANSRVISATDEMLADLVNLRR